MLNSIRIILKTTLSLILVSCAGDKSSAPSDPPPPIQKTWNGEMAAGAINGHDWNFQSGSAHLARKGMQYYFVIRLWAEKLTDPCNQSEGSALQVRITSPRQVSDWTIRPEDPFNADFSVFFSDRDFKPQPLDNMKADEGAISIFDFNKSEVSGYFMGSFKNPKVAKTQVQGGFIVPICSNLILLGDNF